MSPIKKANAARPSSAHGPVPAGDAPARRLAAVILEVLAGGRTPTQAATALGLSLPRYYQLESRALAGLVEACQSKPRGRAANSVRELTQLRQHKQRLERELARQQALVRLTQRTVGVPPPPVPSKDAGGKRRRRKPMVRALRAAQRLQSEPAAPTIVAEASAAATATPPL
jgi:hypothetical protein